MSEQRFDSVWDALDNSPADAANMKTRSALLIAVRDVVDDWKLTQAEAAERLGVTQPRMNDLLRGRIDKFSLRHPDGAGDDSEADSGTAR
ncbi:MAG: XRE family transcriptional regulator [Rhodopseudomonas sp.]